MSITRDEYRYWADYASRNHLHIPIKIVENFDNWRHRSLLGRYLFRFGEYEAAFRILQTVVQVGRDTVEGDLWDVDDMIWCLQVLGCSSWRTNGESSEALHYIDEALRLIAQSQQRFEFVVRGEVWYTRLCILRDSGQVNRALSEADVRVEVEANAKIEYNSYLYYAYRFKAEVAFERGEVRLAAGLIKQALVHFPQEYPDMDQLDLIWEGRDVDPEGTYVRLEELTHHNVDFDRDAKWHRMMAEIHNQGS